MVDKWAYECPRGKNGLHTWCRTGEREEVACVHCKLTLTKEEAVGLGFDPCNHHWRAIMPSIKPYGYPFEPIKCDPVFPKICIYCGATA